MTELSKNMRARIMEAISLIASEEAQRKYQSAVPQVDVPAELFNQWEDCFFPDDRAFQEGFGAVEREALERFNDVLNQVCEETPQQLPNLDEFVTTASWRKLSEAARAALSVLAP